MIEVDMVFSFPKPKNETNKKLSEVDYQNSDCCISLVSVTPANIKHLWVTEKVCSQGCSVSFRDSGGGGDDDAVASARTQGPVLGSVDLNSGIHSQCCLVLYCETASLNQLSM